jgi:hypothetical protein
VSADFLTGIVRHEFSNFGIGFFLNAYSLGNRKIGFFIAL